jgi:hypothetical protein
MEDEDRMLFLGRPRKRSSKNIASAFIGRLRPSRMTASAGHQLANSDVKSFLGSLNRGSPDRSTVSHRRPQPQEFLSEKLWHPQEYEAEVDYLNRLVALTKSKGF